LKTRAVRRRDSNPTQHFRYLNNLGVINSTAWVSPTEQGISANSKPASQDYAAGLTHVTDDQKREAASIMDMLLTGTFQSVG
jgi:hypothetical protein